MVVASVLSIDALRLFQIATPTTKKGEVELIQVWGLCANNES
jgi:hypothetical protein